MHTRRPAPTVSVPTGRDSNTNLKWAATKSSCPKSVPNTLMPCSAVGKSDPLHTSARLPAASTICWRTSQTVGESHLRSTFDLALHTDVRIPPHVLANNGRLCPRGNCSLSLKMHCIDTNAPCWPNANRRRMTQNELLSEWPNMETSFPL